MLEALEKGQPVDLSAMPPPPEGQSDNGGICLGGELGGLRYRAGQASAYPAVWVPRSEGPHSNPSPVPSSGTSAASNGL